MNKRTVGDSARVNLKRTLEAFEYIANSDFKLLYIGYKIRKGDKEYHIQYRCGHEYWLSFTKIKQNKTGLCFKCSRRKTKIENPSRIYNEKPLEYYQEKYPTYNIVDTNFISGGNGKKYKQVDIICDCGKKFSCKPSRINEAEKRGVRRQCYSCAKVYRYRKDYGDFAEVKSLIANINRELQNGKKTSKQK